MLIFSYWDRADLSPIAKFLTEWRGYFPDFVILGDADIERMILRYFPEHLHLFRRIRIPTCKSDVALLLSLYHFGGLYVDCHCGIRKVEGVRQMIEESAGWEVTLYNKSYRTEPRPAGVVRPLNSVMLVQRHSAILMESVALAFKNLEKHWIAERQLQGHVPYDIWTMTGPGVLEHTICIPSPVMWDAPLGLRREIIERVRFIQEGPDAPIVRYRYHSYNEPGYHWSQRQKVERLFLVSDAA